MPLGFSQGAIITLAAIARGFHTGRAIAIAGRLAAPVTAGPPPRVLVAQRGAGGAGGGRVRLAREGGGAVARILSAEPVGR